ncbi:MAG: hypothetical protein ABFD53_09225 [Anaerolineaceae bacterium]
MTKSIVILNDDTSNFKINYNETDDKVSRADLEAQWKSFNRYDPALAQTYKILMRYTTPSMDISVDHFLPPNSTPGRYRIETFIPAVHSNSRKVIFAVTHRGRQVNDHIEEDH